MLKERSARLLALFLGLSFLGTRLLIHLVEEFDLLFSIELTNVLAVLFLTTFHQIRKTLDDHILIGFFKAVFDDDLDPSWDSSIDRAGGICSWDYGFGNECHLSSLSRSKEGSLSGIKGFAHLGKGAFWKGDASP